MAGKRWLESSEPFQIQDPPTTLPLTENFPEPPKGSETPMIDKRLAIPQQKPIQQDNSLLVPKLTKKDRELINEVSLPTPAKFLLNTNQENNQLAITHPLPLIANKNKQKIPAEAILLQKIKLLENQLKQTTTERDNLKQLLHQEKNRANHAEHQLQQFIQQLAPEIYSAEQRTKTEARIVQLPLGKLKS